MSAILFNFLFIQKITHNFVILNLIILIFNQLDDTILITNCDYWYMDDKP